MMKNKIAVMAIVVLLGFTVFAVQDVKADAEGIQGYAIASNQDGNWYTNNVQWTDGTNYFGNITVIDVDDPGVSSNGADDAMNNNVGNNVNDGMDQFSWDASTAEPLGWNTAPAAGNRLLYLAQYNGHADGLSNNWTFCGNIDASGTNVPSDPLELCLHYEPIPIPVLNPNAPGSVGVGVGSTWINISIEHFKYTDWDQVNGVIQNRGTFDCFKSYAVYIKGAEFTDWKYLGNSAQDPNRPQIDPPLAAYNGGDPTVIDTGADYYNATGLGGGTYRLAVAPNFGPVGSNPGPVWGEGGGRGSITPFQNGEPTGPINTPEFGTGMLIPVVATIGMFAAFTIYRRKKEN